MFTSPDQEREVPRKVPRQVVDQNTSVSFAVELAERRLLPDRWVRAGIISGAPIE